MNSLPSSLYVVAIVCATLCFRLLLASLTVTGFDTYGHLYYAQELKRQHSGPFGAIRLRVVGAGEYRHPFLWHWVLGFLSLGWVRRHHKMINPLMDAAFVLVMYIWARACGVSDSTCATAAALYLTAPLWFSSIAVGPRVATLTPRLPSELLTNVYFVLTVAPCGGPLWARASGAVSCGTIVLLSSKFGLQALLFLTPMVALCAGTWLPLWALVGSFIAALAVTRLRFHQTALVQLGHLTWYFRKNRRGEMPVSSRNDLRPLLPRRPLKRWAYTAALTLVQRNSFTAVIIKLPVVVVAVAALTSAFDGTTRVPLWLAGPVVAALVVYLLVNIPSLLFLGEAERYLNHVALFICAVAATQATNPTAQRSIELVIVSGVVFGAAEVIYLQFVHRKGSSSDADARIIDALAALPDPATVLLYPLTKVGSYRVLLDTHHRVIDPVIATNEFRTHFEANYGQKYPYLSLDKLDEMADVYGVDLVVAHDGDLVAHGLPGWSPSDHWHQIVLNQSTYRVFFRGLVQSTTLNSNAL